MTAAHPALQRRLGLGGALTIGLGAMLGAGAFSALAPAAAAAGPWLLIGLVLAALVAAANATSTARLAARHPVSGGAYVYGRERLGPWWGFAAGWAFTVGKSASCAAMALTFAAYTVPPEWQKPVAIAAVLLVSAIDLTGVTKTVVVAGVLVAIVLSALGLVVAGGIAGITQAGAAPLTASAASATPYGVLQSAGFLFFAFAGYARTATLGEEVRRPERTIPRAVALGLALTLLVYTAVAVTALLAVGAPALAGSSAPLVRVIASGWGQRWAWIVGIGAAAGALGSLLSVLAGVSRTGLAMARNGDLPSPLARIEPRRGVPQVAQLSVTALVIAAVALVDLRGAIGFSSFAVLAYYAIANLAAITLGRRAVPITGLAGCLALALALPWPSVVGGAIVVALGLAGRAAARRWSRR